MAVRVAPSRVVERGLTPKRQELGTCPTDKYYS